MTIVYHGSGSAEEFKQFDYLRIGKNGTSEGFGFYFTDSIKIAEGYAGGGCLYTVEFLGRKSLSFTKRTITKDQLSKYLKRLHEVDGGYFLSNWGDIAWDGFNKILNDATISLLESNENDVDLIGDIISTYGAKEEPLNELYKLLGYDSIVLPSEWGTEPHNIYIALVHEAYKIVEVEKRLSE